MKKILVILLLVISAYAGEYSVDNSASKINFSAKKFLFVGVEGEFKKFEGEIVVENDEIISLNGLISIESIFTDHEERDTHLRADDYFDSTKYPKMKFTMISLVSNTLLANVEIKGIKKELKFNIDKFEVKENKLELVLSSIVDRQQFMLNGSMSSVMSDNIDVKATIVANQR